MDCSMRHALLQSREDVNSLWTTTQSMPVAIAERTPRAEASIAAASLPLPITQRLYLKQHLCNRRVRTGQYVVSYVFVIRVG
jgi:hypothetical protein